MLTKQEKIEILDNATDLMYRVVERAYKESRDVNEVKTAIDVLNYIEYFADRLKCSPKEESTEVFSIPDAVNPAPAAAPVQVQSTPTEPETVPEEVQPQYKMEEVRAALAKARGRGVNVSEIIRSFGADNFQQITPDKYPAIMEKLA